MMQKFFVIIYCVILFVFQVKAQFFEFSDNCKNAYINFSALEFNKGYEYLKVEKKENPNNILPVLYENYMDFLQIIIGEQKQDFEKFKSLKKTRIRNLKSGDSNSPYYLYSLANLHLQYALINIHFKNYLTALFDIQRAFQLLEKNTKKFPNFLPQYINFGLLHIMIGSIPDNYKWLTWLASMHGTIEQGYNELFNVMEISQKNSQYNYLLTEAVFLLTFIETNLSSNNEYAEKLLTILNREPNTNPFIVFAKVSILKKNAQNDKAIEILNNFYQNKSSYPYNYLTYLKGLLHLNRLDPKCLSYFQEYINTFKGHSYIKSAYQKMAWMSLIQGNEDNYMKWIAYCKTEGNDYLESDEQAKIEAKKEQVPNVILLKARLLYDGGYFNESLNLLKDFENDTLTFSFNQTERTEFFYRNGRNYQGMGKLDKAIYFFKKAIKEGEDLKEYYAGNSALQLGAIYENKQQSDSAAYFYNTCLDLKFDTYKKSLDFRAKAGLNRLQTKKEVQ